MITEEKIAKRITIKMEKENINYFEMSKDVFEKMAETRGYSKNEVYYFINRIITILKYQTSIRGKQTKNKVIFENLELFKLLGV